MDYNCSFVCAFIMFISYCNQIHSLAQEQFEANGCRRKNIINVQNLLNPTPIDNPIQPWFIFQTITHTVTETYYTTVTTTIPIYQ